MFPRLGTMMVIKIAHESSSLFLNFILWTYIAPFNKMKSDAKKIIMKDITFIRKSIKVLDANDANFQWYSNSKRLNIIHFQKRLNIKKSLFSFLFMYQSHLIFVGTRGAFKTMFKCIYRWFRTIISPKWSRQENLSTKTLSHRTRKLF